VLGGGRYDGLIETLGGPPTPAVGWAAGIERLAMLVGDIPSNETEIAIFTETPELDQLVLEIATLLRRGVVPDRAVRVEIVSGGSRKKRYDKAKASGAWRGLSVESLDGMLGTVRLRDLNVGNATPVRNRITEALGCRFQLHEAEIANAHSWVLTAAK